MDLLFEPEPECYILEISNFQLEDTYTLNAKVACILNISPDHLDRYNNYQEYIDAKQRIYQGCEIAVINRDDAATQPANFKPQHIISFGLDAPAAGQFGMLQKHGENYLAKHLLDFLIAVN